MRESPVAALLAARRAGVSWSGKLVLLVCKVFALRAGCGRAVTPTAADGSGTEWITSGAAARVQDRLHTAVPRNTYGSQRRPCEKAPDLPVVGVVSGMPARSTGRRGEVT